MLRQCCRVFDTMNTYLLQKRVTENIVHDALNSTQWFKPDITPILFSVPLFQFQKAIKKRMERMNNANRSYNTKTVIYNVI